MVILTKAPVLGQVKTRLQPLLGEAETLKLYLALLEDTVQRHANADYAVQLAVAGHLQHPEIVRLAHTYAIGVVAQVGENLGARMQHLAEQALCQYDQVVLVGCDCPALDVDTVAHAFDVLQNYPVVVAPAEDGGYVLLGLREISPLLFEDIVWGGAQVLSDTLARVKKLGWEVGMLDTFWDIDRPMDYQRYVAWVKPAQDG